ncbi:MAG: cyclic nucleotide-binding domain-containing protein [Acidimicrobiia bacterium]|nr:cyclic nucleotide-binding domain-containing protein [Acidimicrobiia bacterium]
MGEVAGAFLLGVISASSLGLGAFTARLWKPTNFVLGLLTAFGAGALLSAVTIDIVAPAVDHDGFGWLAVGAVVGGLAFEILNRTINARGGFLRKASTSITFLRDREQKRIREILDDLERIDIFDGLPDRELDEIGRSFRPVRLDAGEILYHQGDPCEHINILAEGAIALTTLDGVSQLHPHQAFGYLAFVSGTLHSSSAAATVDSEVLRLSRARLRSVLGSCPEFAGRLREKACSESLLATVASHHPELREEQLDAWVARVRTEGIESLPQLVQIDTPPPGEQLIDHLGDVEVFRSLSPALLAHVADLMFREEHEAGYVYFRPGETADRMYFLMDGDVALVDATGESDVTVLLHEGEEFGLHSFMTGMQHTATAIAQSPSEAWVLPRAHFAEFAAREPEVGKAMDDFISSDRITRYLERDQGLDAEQVSGMRRRMHSEFRRGRLAPTVSAKMMQGAPLAIWLGLLLDGIPESLVIGGTADALRVSFVVGIFLSNYPEALSSSVGMREQGFSWRSISLLWGTVILVTGMGAAIGGVVFQKASANAFAVVEGLASGAMLTVITQTMMPEALHRSGGLVGLSALAGFLITTLLGAA